MTTFRTTLLLTGALMVQAPLGAATAQAGSFVDGIFEVVELAASSQDSNKRVQIALYRFQQLCPSAPDAAKVERCAEIEPVFKPLLFRSLTGIAGPCGCDIAVAEPCIRQYAEKLETALRALKATAN